MEEAEMRAAAAEAMAAAKKVAGNDGIEATQNKMASLVADHDDPYGLIRLCRPLRKASLIADQENPLCWLIRGVPLRWAPKRLA